MYNTLNFVEPDDNHQAGSGMEPLQKGSVVYMVQIDELTKRIRLREARAAEKAATEQRLYAEQSAAEEAERRRLRAKAKVIELPALQAEFDAQKARIFPLISNERWVREAEIVAFPKSSWRKRREPEYPMLLLGKISTLNEYRIQLYNVYCRADGELFIRDRRGFNDAKYYSSLDHAFDRGGKEDCDAILKFLKNYTP